MGGGLVFVTVGTTRFQELTSSVVQAEVLQVREGEGQRERERERRKSFHLRSVRFFSRSLYRLFT
jgi:hypothetical protein